MRTNTETLEIIYLTLVQQSTTFSPLWHTRSETRTANLTHNLTIELWLETFLSVPVFCEQLPVHRLCEREGYSSAQTSARRRILQEWGSCGIGRPDERAGKGGNLLLPACFRLAHQFEGVGPPRIAEAAALAASVREQAGNALRILVRLCSPEGSPNGM